MAPHTSPTSVLCAPCIKDWILSAFYNHFGHIGLVVLVFTAIFRSFTQLSSRRKKRRTIGMSFQAADHEKEMGSAKPFTKRVDSGMTAEQNLRLEALRQELSQQTFRPIHPWIAPPTPLPGPYDAPYYPLLKPTLRRSSYDPSSAASEEQVFAFTHHVNTPDDVAEKLKLPIRGTTAVSNHGWKRTQWTVSAG